MKAVIDLIRETIKQWNEDKASRLAAALSFFTMFSIAPLLIIVIAVAGAIFGQEAARGEIVAQMRGLVGTSGAQLIEEMVQNAGNKEAGTVATILSVVTLIIGGSGVFLQLQDALNTIWGVMPRPDMGIKAIIKSRVLSFALVVAIGFMLLVSLVVSAGLAAVDTWLNNAFPGGGILIRLLNMVISMVVVTLLFAMVYKYLPDVNIRWKDVIVGAAVTALLFNIGKYLIGLYLGQSTMASIYGAAGSLVILLVWIFYSAQIVFFGAEFTQVYASKYGTQIEPNEYAVPMTREARARQGIPLQEDVKAAVDLQNARINR